MRWPTAMSRAAGRGMISITRSAITVASRAFTAHAKLGFRCALNAEGATSDQGAWPIVPERAIPRYDPVSDAAYKKLLAYFDYPKTGLNAEVVEVKETDEWRLEKITFDSTAGDRAVAYLYLPKNYPAPFQVIHCVPPSGVEARAYTLSQFIERELRPFIKSGRAVLGVALKGYQEREWPADYNAALCDAGGIPRRDCRIR